MKSKLRLRNKFLSVGMILLLMLFIIACGGGGGGDSAPATYNISGAVSGPNANGVTINLTGAATASTTTDASGNFSFTGQANGTYTVVPVKTGHTFNPVSFVVVVSGASVTNANFVATATSASTYSISGAVSGAVQADVTITLSGGATGTAKTNSSGNYSFSGIVNGNYTVTPSLTGHIFTPANLSITVNSANSTGNNFTSAAVTPPATYGISGAVSGATLAGVTINLTGAATNSTTTDAGGNFSITGLANGLYTVTPVKAGYTFTPTSLAVTVSGANNTGTNFVAAANPVSTYTISGAVSGAVLSGVTITLSGAGSATTTTNASGNYSFSGIANGSYTVTPSLAGYTFSPASSAANVSGANITGTNFAATAITAAAYTQADLTGTWNFQMLETGSSSQWRRGTLTADSSGLLTMSSVIDSAGSTGLPPAGSMQWTINASGVISESGVIGGAQVHMTMTSNKNFIAGTGQSSSGSQLRIAQKVAPGTVYQNADVQSKSFVYHQLSVGSGYSGWEYGAGTTDAAGLITITSWYDPSGAGTPGTGMALSVNNSGIVTMSGKDSFQGFLSNDKKTIVATQSSSGGGSYTLLIVQITGQTYTAGPLPSGISAVHRLAGGAAPAPFWLHFTVTVDSGGGMTYSDWVSSNAAVVAPTTANTGAISSSGAVTIAANASYHGQMSHDGKFIVSTQTHGTGAYALSVSTK